MITQERYIDKMRAKIAEQNVNLYQIFEEFDEKNAGYTFAQTFENGMR